MTRQINTRATFFAALIFGAGFDWLVGIHTVPSTATPSAQKWNDIGADVILAKNFKRLVRRRNTLVSEGVDSFLPCHHAVSILRSL